MKVRYLALLLLLAVSVVSCEKNTVSKIPQIGLLSFGPPVVRVNIDTARLIFSIRDGDGDLGLPQNGTDYDIYIKDFRYPEAGFTGYFFPIIDVNIEDPAKGVRGICEFQFLPFMLVPRLDSIHITNGDTTHFEFYIKDRAGNTSNVLSTENIIMDI